MRDHRFTENEKNMHILTASSQTCFNLNQPAWILGTGEGLTQIFRGMFVRKLRGRADVRIIFGDWKSHFWMASSEWVWRSFPCFCFFSLFCGCDQHTDTQQQLWRRADGRRPQQTFSNTQILADCLSYRFRNLYFFSSHLIAAFGAVNELYSPVKKLNEAFSRLWIVLRLKLKAFVKTALIGRCVSSRKIGRSVWST